MAAQKQNITGTSESDEIESPCIILDQVDAEEEEPKILRMQSVKVPSLKGQHALNPNGTSERKGSGHNTPGATHKSYKKS